MRGQFILGIQHLKCRARLGAGIALNSDLRIINDWSNAKCLRSSMFSQLAGTLEVSALKEADLLIISEDQEFPDIDGPLLISRILNIVLSYLSALWIVKDNTPFFDRGYFLQDDRLHSNTQLSAQYNYLGQRRTTDVSRAELEGAKLFLRPHIRNLTPEYDILSENHMLRGQTTPAHRSVPLPERFLGFVRLYRESIDLPFRIAMACSALEVLFSTGTNELSHRVSERVAFLLKAEPNQRRDTYNSVKRLYAIRSAFLHGDTIASKDERELHLRSREADEILRAVTEQLLTSDKFASAAREGKVALEQAHSDLLFGIKDSRAIRA